MIALLQGEWLKIRRQRLIYFVLVCLFVLTVANGLYQATQQPAPVTDGWKQVLHNRLAELEEQQQKLLPGTLMYESNRERMVLYHYQLEHDIPPDRQRNVWRFIADNNLLLAIAGLYLITMSVYIVASEYQQGTVKFLFLKPVQPLLVMVAKWLTISLLLFAVVSFLLAISWLTGLVLFGASESMETLVVVGDEVEVQHLAFSTLRHYAFTVVSIWVMCAGAFTLACVLRSVAVATAISLFLYYSGELVTRLLAARFEWAKYVLFANTDLNAYFEGRALAEGMSLTFSLTLLLVYVLLFAAVVFQSVYKKDVPLS